MSQPEQNPLRSRNELRSPLEVAKPFGFDKSKRLRKTAEFDRVFRGNVYAADNMLVIQGVENNLDQCRIGISVSRKFGNAVARNRWKRLIRENFRTNQHRFRISLDLVVRPRKGAQPGFPEIRDSLLKLYQVVCRKIQRRANQRLSSSGPGKDG